MEETGCPSNVTVRRVRLPQVDRIDGWPHRLPRELDRTPPTGRLTVTDSPVPPFVVLTTRFE